MSTSDVRQSRATDPSRSLQAALPMPDEVRLVMAKACNNCHTSETKWPWYSRIAPANRLIEYDVKRARAAVNFSEWSDRAGTKKGTAMGMLMAACEGAKTRRMPPIQYRLMHPEATLTASEIDSLCTWTQTAVRQIKEATSRNQASVAPSSQ